MTSRHPFFRIAIATLVTLTLLGTPALASPVRIPDGTPVYVELAEDVTSRKLETARGDIVRARVFRDVEVGGHVVIEEGAEAFLRVGYVKKARFLGRKGHLVLEAVSVEAADGTTVALDGNQYRAGKGRKAAAGTLAVSVAWPFLFLRGKNARAAAGTVLEARVDRNVEIELGYATERGPGAARP